MDPTNTLFSHWNHRRVGDPSLYTASMTLLFRLLAQGQPRRPRAWLAQPAALPLLRQTLAIAFDAPLVLSGQDQPCQGLWLVEQANGKVLCFAVHHRPHPDQIGGRVVRGQAPLDPAAPWVTGLTGQLAAQPHQPRLPSARVRTVPAICGSWPTSKWPCCMPPWPALAPVSRRVPCRANSGSV